MKIFTHALFFLCLLVWAAPAQASLTTIRGFTLNTETQIVTGNGLEWLRWETTAQMSINEALAQFQSSGWRLAQYQEVVDMMSVFFRSQDWTPALDENTSVSLTLDHNRGRVRLWHNLTTIMGAVLSPGPSFSDMLFGDDADGDGHYRMLSSTYSEYDPIVSIHADYHRATRDYSAIDSGVLLVRGPKASISAPPSWPLILLAMVFVIQTKLPFPRISHLNLLAKRGEPGSKKLDTHILSF